jgi:hypothetical protein
LITTRHAATSTISAAHTASPEPTGSGTTTRGVSTLLFPSLHLELLGSAFELLLGLCFLVL